MSDDPEIYSIAPPDDFLEVVWGITFARPPDEPMPKHEWFTSVPGDEA